MCAERRRLFCKLTFEMGQQLSRLKNECTLNWRTAGEKKTERNGERGRIEWEGLVAMANGISWPE